MTSPGGDLRAAQTGAALEYLSDLHDIATPHPERRRVTDPKAAADLIAAETVSRVQAVCERFPGDPVLLLSGGVDSILVAAAAVSVGIRPHTITVATPDSSDRTGASAAAAALGLAHEVVELDHATIVELAGEAVARLGLPELWEVSYAIPLLAAVQSVDELGAIGPILTGGGADAIFAGGRPLHHDLDSAEATAEMDQIIRTESAANFTITRLVPDFHERVLPAYAEKFVHMFQTLRWWELSEQLAAPALFGERDGQPVDKLAVRIAAEQLLPAAAAPLAWAKKSPIQRSAGIMGALTEVAREFAAALPGAQTYTDPLTEPADAVAARLFLALLSDTDYRQNRS
ncbi:asparagine synthase-related protein [Nocardia sp. NPDC051832]|uniref:asparagine synthase-related protein n=1 Tax=Nocardia sp. NPDC051832 TaxID=3155673 RepID=UPI003414DE34